LIPWTVRPTLSAKRLIRSTVPSPNRAALLFPAHGTVPYTVLINASTYFRWAPPTLGCPTILICLYIPYYQHSHVRQQDPFCCPVQPTVRLSSIFTHSQYFVFSNAHVSLLHLCRESQHSLCDIPGNGPRTHRGTAAYYMQHTGFLFSQHFFQPSLRVLPLTVGAAPLIPRGVSTLAPCGMSTQSRSL
jgi:hypothetical protein